MILIVVLVVIGVLTLAGMTFAELMLAEREAAELSARRTQGRALVNSGVEAVRLFLSKTEDEMLQAGGWYNDARKRGRFTVVSPYYEDSTSSGIRFGLADESTRFNINTLALLAGTDETVGRDMLMALPGMTEEIADAILDWIDEDDEPREFGAELEYYSALGPPYAPKNGLLETIEELLLVRDVTPWLLFGADTNRNGLVDSGEPDPQMIGEVDNSDGSMNCGWAAYLTLYSQESNLNPEGEPKIDVNQDDLEKLYKELLEVVDENWANFIVGYRMNSSPAPATLPKAPTSGTLKLSGGSGGGGGTFETVLDLIGLPSVEVEYEGQQGTYQLECPFPNDPVAMASYLPDLMDNLTVVSAETIVGRININQAPEFILSAIPGFTPEIVERILADRISDPFIPDSPPPSNEAWILSQGIVTLEEMKQNKMMTYICSGGSSLRGQIIGYFDGGGPSIRVEVVFDTTKQPPAVLFWRDMSHLGRGYALETLGVEAGTTW
jgi:type II secretory pathway component PulK